MLVPSKSHRMRAVVLTAVMGVAGFLAVGNRQAVAADSLKESTSLKFIPADAAFYSTTLRLKEQFDAFVGSRAFARIKAMPVVQMAVAQFQMELANAPYAAALAAPENQELIRLLKELASEEIFLYGDDSFADLAALFAAINSANQMGQFENAFKGQPGAQANDPRQILIALDRNREKLKTPNLVVGFKISGKQRAEKQLARLKTLIEAAITDEPDLKKLKGRFQTTRVGGHNHLTLRLSGSLLPWDEFPIAQVEEKPGEFDKLIAHLKKMQVTISLGIRGDYLLLGVGRTLDHLKTLDGKTSLYDTKEFAPLRKHAAKPITSIAYISAKYAQLFNNSAGQLNQILDSVEAGFKNAPVDDKLKRELEADIKKIRKELSGPDSTAGATLSYSFRSSHGHEAYTYNWSENDSLDGSQKLSLLNHVGGNPIAFFVGRTKSDPEEYALSVKILKRLFYYGEKTLLSQLDAAQSAQYQQVRTLALPLIARLHKANTESLIPALKDGQSGIVLDAKITSRQWFREMPPAGKPLPMLEPALIFGVSNARLLKKGTAEYFAVAQEFLNGISQQFPQIPPVQIPAATTKQTASGTVYSYQQLADLGVDSQIAPSAGVSKDVAVLSTSPQLVERLLQSKTLTLPAGFHSNFNRNLMTAAYFNWPGFVDAVAPWVDYAVRGVVNGGFAANEEGAVAPPDTPQTKAILSQVREGIAILKCFRGASTISYREGKATVTHTHSVWRDLAK